MKFGLLFIFIILAIGMLFSVLGLAQHGLLVGILAAFGLLTLVAVTTLLYFANKQKTKPGRRHE